MPLVLKNGPPRLIKDGKFPSSFTVGTKNYSFIVISPQYSSSSDYVTAINSLINYCKSKYRVDETKIYLTGLSMGGLLTFNYCGSAKTNAEKFAAILTVCGGSEPTTGRVANIATGKLPVWVTNNSGDPYNSAALATETVRLLNAYVPAPPKAILTIFNKSGHDAWTPTYDPNFRQNGLSVYEWMLTYSRGSTSSTAPAPPIAEAGPNQIITLPTSSVTLDGSKSTAASGYTIKTYAWSKVSGPTGAVITTVAGKITTVTALVAGTYVFQLKVTDSNGNTDTDTVTITVNAATTVGFKADAGADQTITLPTRSVILNGTKSTAATGYTLKSYAWSIVSGPINSTFSNKTSSTTTVSNLVPGKYVFQLKITDNASRTTTDNITVTVKYINGTLKANAGADQTLTYPLSAPVTLNGGSSTAPSTSTVTCSWTRLSGPGTVGAVIYPSVNLITKTAQNLTAGVYQYQLTVRDAIGNESKDVVVITVKSSTSARTASSIEDSQSSEDATALSAEDVSPLSSALEVKINPNPVTTDMNVWIDGTATGRTNILVYDLKGSLLSQQAFTKDVPGMVRRSFNVSNLQSGTYFVKVVVNNNVTKSTQMIKQ